MATEMGRCDNLSCVCEIPLGEVTTCSDYCRSDAGKDVSEIRCACGHDVCSKAIDEQLHGGSGTESP